MLDGNKKLAQEAWNLVNDSLRTTACVHFSPESIAATAIYVGARRLRIALPHEWWRLFDVPLDDIAQVAQLIYALYQQPRASYVDVAAAAL